ncbi:MAG: hypothetical protein IPM50_11070 [Acidobacteriota bacterium]|nr:MAG: hypothetical protein IPM50_11070 [Acidobacteriota bacterium]
MPGKPFIFLFLAATVLGLLIAIPMPTGPIVLGILVALLVAASLVLSRVAPDKEWIIMILLLSVGVRIALGVVLEYFGLQGYFGSDSTLYHAVGVAVADEWSGISPDTDTLARYVNPYSGAGWGMMYLTGSIYYVFGHELFISQSVVAFFGALSAPLTYLCSYRVFNNAKSAKIASVIVAIFPPFVIWSSQLLKDGLLVFLLVLVMLLVMRLKEKIDILSVLVLLLSLVCILSLRFYIFYIVLVAIVGSFVIAYTNSTRAIARNTVIMVLLTIGLQYLGIQERAEIEVTAFADLERINISRQDLARSAESGFGEDWDVSTPAAALVTIPRAAVYLMLAPYPWHITNLRQALTLPDMMIWWAMVPFLIIGLGYAIRNRLRDAFPIMFFSLLLIIAYSIFLGNVGTAYRQRTQIQVFLVIIAAVGWTYVKEQRENRRLVDAAAARRVQEHRKGLRAGQSV